MFRKVIRAVLAVSFAAATTLAHADPAKVVVGGKNFTEQRIMAEMTAEYLKAKGFDVDLRTDMGSTLTRKAQEQGQIDLYWEYTGSSLVAYNHVNEKLTPDQAYQKVKELDAKKGIVWLNPSKANDTYAFAVREEDQAKLHLTTLSDLAAAINSGKDLTVAAGDEFVVRPDGLPGLEKAYGFKFSRDQLKQMDIGLCYSALQKGQVNIAMVYSTDGRISAFKFVTLKDDKNFFPSYAMAPVVRAETLKKYPQLANLMDALSAKIDDATMRKLNAQVDVEKKSVEEVSHDFLVQQKLI